MVHRTLCALYVMLATVCLSLRAQDGCPPSSEPAGNSADRASNPVPDPAGPTPSQDPDVLPGNRFDPWNGSSADPWGGFGRPIDPVVEPPLPGEFDDLPAAPPEPPGNPNPAAPPPAQAQNQAGAAANAPAPAMSLGQWIRLQLMGASFDWAKVRDGFQRRASEWVLSESEEDSWLDGLGKGAASMGSQVAADWADAASAGFTFARAVYDKVTK